VKEVKWWGHVAGMGRKQIQGFDGDIMKRDFFADLGVDYRIRFFFKEI